MDLSQAQDLKHVRLPPERIGRLTGFGLSSSADAYLYRPTSVEEIREIFTLAKDSGRKVVLRGAGRSYGDASIARECIGVDISRMDRVLSWDQASGVIECEGGVTIEKLWRHTLEDGWWPPVVSGTMFPTLAGALAMNIHGKNNFCAGTLGEHVLEMEVLFPNGELVILSPTDELFSCVISGAGLLGAVTRIKLQMKKVSSGMLRVLPLAPASWEEQFACFEKFEAEADYMVSWIDCFASGRSAGRGQFHAAWYSQELDGFQPTLRPEHQDLPDTVMGFYPKSRVWKVLKKFNNPLGMRFLNWAKYTGGRLLGNGKPYPQSLVGFSFLLDYVPHWRRAYLPHGFIQYQCFVPKQAAKALLPHLIQLQQRAGIVSFLGVLKRHRPDGFLFSHGVDGYSLALDFKITRTNKHRLFDLCHAMNAAVLANGGRFYFAKDSTLRPDDVQRYLGEEALAKFRQIKSRVDPDGLLTSELGKRVGLV